MNFSTFGHLASIGWGGPTTDGLRAEYGRLRRCLEGNELAPPGHNIFEWRQTRARWYQYGCMQVSNEINEMMAAMDMFRGRMRHLNKALYDVDVILGYRRALPVPAAGASEPTVPYVRYVLSSMPQTSADGQSMIRENSTALVDGDREVEHDGNTQPLRPEPRYENEHLATNRS